MPFFARDFFSFLDQSRFHMILARVIQGVCHMTPALSKFFARTNNTSLRALPQQVRHPMHLITKCPANTSTAGMTAPTTPPRGHYPGAASVYVPNLGQVCAHRLPRLPLRIVEVCGGLVTGLEALLRAGYAIISYVWVDTNLDAHTAASHRIAHLIL